MKCVALTLLALASVGLADVSHILPYDQYELITTSTTTPPPPPHPYKFKYAAGRYPGQIDRIHQESGDGSGTVHGKYSYIDPKFKVRTVEYTADQNGFHPLLTNFEDTQRVPVDSEAVNEAKQKHYALYERIANEHAQGVQGNVPVDVDLDNRVEIISNPQESASVERAKERHYALFNKIAQEHAAIGAQREAERLAFEATSVPNDVHDEQIY